MRHQKDRSVMAKAAGDDDMRREAQERINLLASKYKKFSDASGLPTKMERARVSGYRRVKTKAELTNTNKKDIIDNRKFIPVKTIQEAEEFVKQYVDASQFGALGISYSGISVETANMVNKTLFHLYNTFDIDALGGVFVPKGNSKLGKQIDGAVAGYSPIRKSLILNRNALNDPQKIIKSHKEELRLIKMFSKDNSSVVFKTNLAEQVARASLKSGRATVPETVAETIWHEMGHSVESKVRMMNGYADVRLNMKVFAENISGYATTKESEYIAESFASYMKGENKIDPHLKMLFERLRKR